MMRLQNTPRTGVKQSCVATIVCCSVHVWNLCRQSSSNLRFDLDDFDSSTLIRRISLDAPCNILQHPPTYRNELQHNSMTLMQQISYHWTQTATHCNTLQHTATYCNTLRHTATHCSIPGNSHRRGKQNFNPSAVLVTLLYVRHDNLILITVVELHSIQPVGSRHHFRDLSRILHR